ncbi:hypothetical protein V6N13_022361 [Hibiscus sabdariffa]
MVCGSSTQGGLPPAYGVLASCTEGPRVRTWGATLPHIGLPISMRPTSALFSQQSPGNDRDNSDIEFFTWMGRGEVGRPLFLRIASSENLTDSGRVMSIHFRSQPRHL